MAVNTLTAATLTVGSPVFGVVLVNHIRLPLLDEHGNILLDEHGVVLYSDTYVAVTPITPSTKVVASPAFTAPVIKITVAITAPVKAVGSPVFTVPTLVAVVATSPASVTVGSPVFTAPVFKGITALSSVSKTVGSPVFTVPTVGSTLVTLTATSKTVGSPILGIIKPVLNEPVGARWPSAYGAKISCPSGGGTVRNPFCLISPTTFQRITIGTDIGVPGATICVNGAGSGLIIAGEDQGGAAGGDFVIVAPNPLPGAPGGPYTAAIWAYTGVSNTWYALQSDNTFVQQPDAPPFPAANLTVGSPVIGVPVYSGTKVLAAPALTVASPVLGAPSLVQKVALPVGISVNVASPVLGIPSYVVVAALPVSALATTSPAIGSPVFMQRAAFAGGSLAASPLALGAPVLVQNVAFPASISITVASPSLAVPGFGRVLAATSITVSSPAFTQPLAVPSLFGGSLAVAQINFTLPAMVQKQVIAPAGLTVGSPALPALLTISKVVLAPLGLATGSPSLVGAAIKGLLDPVALAPASPALGAPTIGQRQVLAAAFTVGSPDLPARTLYQVQKLAATGITTGSPIFSLTTTRPALPLVSGNLIVGSPVFTPAQQTVRYNLSTSFNVASLGISVPTLSQLDRLSGTGITVGRPALDQPFSSRPINNLAPSANGQWILSGSPYSLVSDLFHFYTIASDGTIYRDGVLTQPSVNAVGIEKATSQTMLGDISVIPMLWAWGSFGWAYFMAGVWVNSSAPNLLFPTTSLTVHSPTFTLPTAKQVQKVSPLGLTVGRPAIGVTAVRPESAPGSYAIYPVNATTKLWDLNGNIWTFGAVNPQNASEALVLRNGVNPYGTPLYASVIQIGPPQFTYVSGGVTSQANWVGWVLTAHRQWYFDNGGTAMVPWPAPPNFTMARVGITTARPTIGTGPTLARRNAFGITVGRPDIGTGIGLTTAPLIKTYVFLPAPIGINLGPGNIVVAWPKVGEVNRLVAESLNVWVPDIGSQPLAVALAGNIIGTTDKINPYIDLHAPSALLYRAASGLEKALADTDGLRLMATYAELIKDQWDPYAISSNNLPYLAFAMGVNLWEADWSDHFRRWWTANQWELQSQRGSLLGSQRFVSAVGCRVAHAIVPPYKFHPGKSYTAEERAQYNSRFAQLRIYPFVARVQLPWLCYVSNFRVGIEQKRRYTNNGCFIGPLRKFYPTSADAGGRYTRTATIWDRGVETPITFRTYKDVSKPGIVTTWDEVVVPAKIANHWYLNQPDKWPLPKGHPVRQNKYGIFLGIMDETAKRIIKIPRSGELDVNTAKAIYQTIVPDNTYIDVYPQHVATPHSIGARRLYNGAPYKRQKQFLFKKFLPVSGSFKYLYEVWYIFDYARVPDYRRASVYMGRARFGIHKYTAELKIEIPIKWRKWYLYNGGFMRGHFHPPDTRDLDKCRRAVTASMAVRDTVRIDTTMKRRVNTNDSLPCDGTFTVGQYIDA